MKAALWLDGEAVEGTPFARMLWTVELDDEDDEHQAFASQIAMERVQAELAAAGFPAVWDDEPDWERDGGMLSGTSEGAEVILVLDLNTDTDDGAWDVPTEIVVTKLDIERWHTVDRG